jgi:uncharacterized protein YndB with AHSA1/START domain
MEPIQVTRSIWIAAPRPRVWSAITEPNELQKWFLSPYFPAELKLDEAGGLRVCMGPMETVIATFEGHDAPRQVTSRSQPDGVLATTYALEEENGGTRVTVTMRGFESLSEDAIHDRLEPSSKGWQKALENLKAYVEGAGLPHPEGFLTTLYGYRRESASKISLERSIWINAPRERVWQAITDPEQIALWFSPGTTWRTTGQGVGARLSVYNAETDTDMYVQVTEVYDPPHQLATRSEPEPPDTPHVTLWTLEAENGGTRLTLTYSGFEQEPEGVRFANLEQHAFGFGMMLENLRAALHGEALPYPGGF